MDLIIRKDLCYHKHPDCFARQRNGICQALRDTDFNGRDCPFYKSREQNDRENNRIREKAMSDIYERV